MLNSNHPIGKPLFCILSLLTTVLHALSQPVIDSQPKDLTALAGTDAVFSVVATGTPPLSYQWRRFIGGTTSLVLTGATEATLILPAITYSQNGFRYSVIVSKTTGSVTSQTARLTVLSPPFFPTPPTNLAVLPGQTATFAPTIGGTAPFRYQWMFQSPDAPIPNATNRSFVVKNVQPAHTGSYYLVVTNAYGAVTNAPARLSIFWAPMTGTDIPALARLDTNMQSLLVTYGIPGGALAVVKDGRLVFTRGYGYADTNTARVVEPDALFRIGSNSKLITAAATMKLVEDGRLKLNDSAFRLLQYPTPNYPGSTNDPRLGSVTVQQLLNHTGGWDESTAHSPYGEGYPFDPTVWFQKPAQDLGLTGGITTSNLLYWITGLPLQFDPGTGFKYSNVGYQALGRVIEKVTGRPYEEYVRELLRSVAATRSRISADTPATLHPGQVMNYDYPRALGNPVVAGRWGDEIPPNEDPMPYSVRVSLFDAMGGWITSPIDYLRFVTSIDGRPSPRDMLSAESVKLMQTATALSVNAGQPYGMGLNVNLPGPGDFYHGGLVAGSRSKMFHFANGVTVMAVVNFYPYLDDTFELSMENLLTGIPGTLRSWPTHDFFGTTLSYEAWRENHFTAIELSNSSLSGDTADFDGDGVVNLLEYAFGSDPKSASPAQLPSGSVVTVEGQTYFALTFRRLILGYELDYTVEASDDLLTWSPITDELGSPQLNSDGTQTITIRDRLPIALQSQRFLRLRVARQLP